MQGCSYKGDKDYNLQSLLKVIFNVLKYSLRFAKKNKK